MTSTRTILTTVAAVAALLAIGMLVHFLPRSTSGAEAVAPAEVAAVVTEGGAVLEEAAPAGDLEEAPQLQEPASAAEGPADTLADASDADDEEPPTRSARRETTNCELVGQLVDLAGNPLGERLRVQVRCVRGRWDSEDYLGTAEDGTFRQAVRVPIDCDDHMLRLSSANGAVKWIRIALREGPNDLGRIVLVPYPVIVAGSVVEPDGTPTVGARVVIYPDVHTRGDFGLKGALATLATDLDGRFVVRSEQVGERLLVQVSDKGGRQTSVATHFGDEECRVVMPESMARVGLEVLLPPSAPRTPYLAATLVKDPTVTRAAYRSVVHPGETVEFSSVAPGVYSLRLTGGWLLGDVELETAVEVLPSPDNSAQWLGTYDLNSLLGEVRLTLSGSLPVDIAVPDGARSLEPGITHRLWIPVEGVSAVLTHYAPNPRRAEAPPVRATTEERHITPGVLDL